MTEAEDKIKVLLGMLARLPWGRRGMLGSMNGKHEGVYVKCITNNLLPLHKSIHYCMMVKDSGKCQVYAEMCQFHEKVCLKC